MIFSSGASRHVLSTCPPAPRLAASPSLPSVCAWMNLRGGATDNQAANGLGCGFVAVAISDCRLLQMPAHDNAKHFLRAGIFSRPRGRLSAGSHQPLAVPPGVGARFISRSQCLWVAFWRDDSSPSACTACVTSSIRLDLIKQRRERSPAGVSLVRLLCLHLLYVSQNARPDGCMRGPESG